MKKKISNKLKNKGAEKQKVITAIAQSNSNLKKGCMKIFVGTGTVDRRVSHAKAQLCLQKRLCMILNPPWISVTDSQQYK